MSSKQLTSSEMYNIGALETLRRASAVLSDIAEDWSKEDIVLWINNEQIYAFQNIRDREIEFDPYAWGLVSAWDEIRLRAAFNFNGDNNLDPLRKFVEKKLEHLLAVMRRNS